MLIALCGRAGSGKTTVATYLKNKYGARVRSFAKPLKEISKEFFGFTDEQVYGTQAQKETPDPRWMFSPRAALQMLGSACRKHLGEDVWADALLRDYRHSPGVLDVIEDCRYPNEAEKIREHGGIIVKLVCPDRSSFADEQHESEAGVDLIDPSFTVVAERSADSKLLIQLFTFTLRRTTCVNLDDYLPPPLQLSWGL